MTHNLLSWSDEKIAVQKVFQKQLHEGDIWFIIEAAFWNCWKEYVGWSVERKDSERPTEINNELLMEQDINDSAINFFSTTDESLQLKRGIVEGRDFAIINQETFSLFKQWYQLTGPEIPRKVIEVGVKSKLVVEIHPLKITIFVDSSQKQSFLFYFGRNTRVADLKQQVISSLKLTPSQLGDWQIWTLWNRTKESQLDESSNLQLSLAEVGLDGSHELLFQKAGVIENNSTESKVLTTLNGNICIKKDGTPKGLTGLMNLGNTCFLNSAIQGLSNTSELRQYFLSGKYRTDINTTNPIGTKGEMAESFSGLLRDLWAGDIQYIAPKEFKRRLGKHAPQFAGYDQHDSQEVLSYMLDAIHEDLNRVKDKPFIPIQDVSSHEMEYQDSKRFWENHLKRNDSVVVDLFQAQFKSTICCPDCNKISITFDPLMYLSLPLPLNSLSKFQITYVSSSAVLRFWIQSKATDSIQILKQQVATFLATKDILTTVPEAWIVTEIMNSRFHKYLNDGSILDDIHPDHKIVIYDIPKDDLASPCSILLPCVQSVVSPTKFKDTRKLHPIHETFNYIGIPILVKTQRINSCSAIYDLVWSKLQFTNLAIAFREEEYPFVLHLMNRNGSFSRILDTDDQTPPIQNGQYLIIEWDIKVDRDNHLSKSLAEAISIENPFALRKDTEIALEDCLDHFTKTEKLGESDKWYCSQCKDHKQATKKMELFSLPKMLIVHLKRFNFVNALWRDKIGVPVRYPISNWDISKKVLATNHDSSQRFVYDLYSVVNHFGNTFGGHYTNLSYNDELKHWVLYDDQKCVVVEEDAVLSENAYLLFYKRRG